MFLKYCEMTHKTLEEVRSSVPLTLKRTSPAGSMSILRSALSWWRGRMVDRHFLASILSEISVPCPIMIFYTLLCCVQVDELVA